MPELVKEASESNKSTDIKSMNTKRAIIIFICPSPPNAHSTAVYSPSSAVSVYLKDGFRSSVVCPVSSVDVSRHLGQFVSPWRRLSLFAAALILRREMHTGLQFHRRLYGPSRKEKEREAGLLRALPVSLRISSSCVCTVARALASIAPNGLLRHQLKGHAGVRILY